MEVAIKILQLLVSKLSGESMNIERFLELSLVVSLLTWLFFSWFFAIITKAAVLKLESKLSVIYYSGCCCRTAVCGVA